MLLIHRTGSPNLFPIIFRTIHIYYWRQASRTLKIGSKKGAFSRTVPTSKSKTDLVWEALHSFKQYGAMYTERTLQGRGQKELGTYVIQRMTEQQVELPPKTSYIPPGALYNKE